MQLNQMAKEMENLGNPPLHTSEEYERIFLEEFIELGPNQYQNKRTKLCYGKKRAMKNLKRRAVTKYLKSVGRYEKSPRAKPTPRWPFTVTDDD